MNTRSPLAAARIAFGLLGLAAIAAQLSVHIQSGSELVNFFSFFTILSNMLAAVVLLMAGIRHFRDRESSVAEETARGASVAAMGVVGIVFSVLLRDVDPGSLMPWVNITLHYVMPVVVTLDWIVQPPEHALAIGNIGKWAIFPLAYLVYTLARGAAVGWYPYPFLDPANVGGYGGVALYVVAIVVVFLVMGGILLAVANASHRRAG